MLHPARVIIRHPTRPDGERVATNGATRPRPAAGRQLASAAAQVLVLVIAYFALPLGRGSGFFGAVLATVAILGLLPYTFLQARTVLSSDRPLLVAIRAASLLLTVLIVGFAAAYYTVSQHTTGQINGVITKLDALYFTVTVVSTVGFGDITAVGQTARAVVTIQMIFDLAFLAIAVRVLARAAEQAHSRRQS